MKGTTYKLRKPLSYLLAMLLLLSSLSVGLTVWAADVNQEKPLTMAQRLEALSKAEEKAAKDMTWEEFDAKLESIRDDSAALLDFLAAQLEDEMVDYALSDIRDEKLNIAELSFQEIMTRDLGTMGSTSGGNTRYGFYLRDLPNGQIMKFAMTYWAVFDLNAMAAKSGAAYSDMHWAFEEIYLELKKRLDKITYDMPGAENEPLAAGYDLSAAPEKKYMVFLRAFSGMWETWKNPTSSNYQRRWVCTILPAAGYEYLTRFTTLDEIPDTVITQFGMAAAQERTGSIFSYKYHQLNKGTIGGFANAAWVLNKGGASANYWTPFENSGISYAADTTSKAALTTFEDIFTADVLNAESVTELSSEKIYEIVENAAACLQALSGASKAVADHFFPGLYEGNAFERAQDVYEEAVAFIATAKASYIEVVRTADTKYGGAYVLTAADLAVLEEALLQAQAYYTVLTEAQKAEGEVSQAKALQDALRAKLEKAQQAIYQTEYQTYLKNLADDLRQDFVRDAFLSNPMRDDDSRVQRLAESYASAAQRLIALDSSRNTASLLKEKIAVDLKQYMTESEFAQYAVSAKLALLACDGAAENGTVSLTIDENKLLHEYSAIANIPESYAFKRAVLSYRYVDGTLANRTAIRWEVIEVTDDTAKVNFTLWDHTFHDTFMQEELSTLDIAALLERRAQAVAAFEAVAAYTEATLAHLLTGDTVAYAAALQRREAIEHAIADLYVALAQQMELDYAGMDPAAMDKEESRIFVDRMAQIAIAYADLDASVLERSDVVAAEAAMEKLLTRFNNYYIGLYLSLGDELLENYFVDGAPNVTAANVVSLKNLIKRLNSLYDEMTEMQRQDESVQEIAGLLPAFEELIAAVYLPENWKEITIDYSGMDRVDQETLQQTVDMLDNMVAALAPELLQLQQGETLGDFLQTTIEKNLFTADTINLLMSNLYPLVYTEVDKTGLGSLVGLAGLYIAPNTVKNRMDQNKYTTTIQALDAAGSDWNAVDWTKVEWVDYSDPENPVPVHDYDTFCNALASALGGVWKALRALLYDESISVIVEILPGNPGYQNVIEPIYKQLGCSDYVDYKTMKADSAWNNAAGAAEHIKKLFNPIWNVVKAIGDAPVDRVLQLLPRIAYLLHYNQLQAIVDELIAPLSEKFGMAFELPDFSDLNALLDGLLVDANGNKLLELPFLNTGEIAGIATLAESFTPPIQTGALLNVKQDEMLVYLLRFLAQTIQLNQEKVMGLLPDNTSPAVIDLLDTVLQKDADTMINALIGFLNPRAVEDVSWDMSGWVWNESRAAYPEDGSVTDKEAAQAVAKLDLILHALLNELMGKDLSELVDGVLFTPDHLNQLIMTIYRGIASAGLGDIFLLLGVDLSQEAVAQAVADYSSDAAEKIRAAESWESVDLTGCVWNVDVTQSDQFAGALTAVLTPFSELLDAVLTGKDITLFGGFCVAGGNGYQNAVLPLLQALGAKNAYTAEAYTAFVAQNPGKALQPILLAAFDVLDEVLENPAGTLAEKLPNFANFMANGGLTKAVNALLLPITNLAEPLLTLFADEEGIAPGLFDLILEIADIQLPDGVNFNNLESSIVPMLNSLLSNVELEGTVLSLSLPEINWAVVAGHGELNSSVGLLEKARALFTGGLNPTYFEIEANVGDTTMAVLNYAVESLKANQSQLLVLLKILLTQQTGEIDDAILSLVKDMVSKLMANPTPDISGALIRVLLTENPEDVDWNAYDFFWALAEAVYPEGMTGERVEEAIATFDQAIANILQDLFHTNLNDMVGGMLYTTENLTTAVNAFYTALEAQEQMLSLLNITLPDITELKLDGSTRESFVAGLSDALAPFAPVLKAMLTGENLKLLNALELKGANGYKNAILPLLYAFGCDSAMSAAAYQDAVAADDSALISAILNPILDQVELILSSPADAFTDLLPNFAYFVSNGGVSKALNHLLLPITNLADPVLSLVTEKSLLNFFLEVMTQYFGVELPIALDASRLEEAVIPLLNALLADVEIGGQKGFSLPEIDWAKLAGYGELKNRNNPLVAALNGTGNSVMNRYVQANQGDVLIGILQYIVRVLHHGNNAQLIQGLVSGAQSDLLNKIVGNVMDLDANTLITILVHLLAPTGEKSYGSWLYVVSVKEAVTTYTTHLGREDFEAGVAVMDENILGLLSQLAGIDSLLPLLSENLYTQEMASTIAETVFGMLTVENLGFDLIGTLQLASIDLSPRGVAANLTEPRYKRAVQLFNEASDWSEVNFGAISWGFQNGNRAAFIGTLVALLRPLEPILRYVLAGEDLYFFDSIHLTGGEGYNNAIIPLLEALHCDDIKSAAEYKERINKDRDFLLLDMINPIFDKIEEVLNKPVDTLTDVLPDLALLMANNGVEQLVRNLILPVTDLLAKIAPVYQVNIDLSGLRNLDLISLANNALADLEINGTTLGINLLPLDWKKLASRGKQTTMQSLRVDAQGDRVTVPCVDADQAAVLVSALRYLVDTIKQPQNLAAINALVGDLGDAASMVTGLLATLGNAPTDDTVELLMQLLAGSEWDEDSEAPGGSSAAGSNDSVTQITPIEEDETTTSSPSIVQDQHQNGGDTGGQNQNDTDQKANWPLIIGCSIGGLALIALIVCIVLYRRKKHSGKEMEIPIVQETTNVKK